MDGDCIEGRNEDDKMDRWIYMVLHSNTPYHRDKSYRSLMILSPVHIRSGNSMFGRKPLQYLVMKDYIRSFSN